MTKKNLTPPGWRFTRSQYQAEYAALEAVFIKRNFPRLTILGQNLLRGLPRTAPERGDVLHLLGVAAALQANYPASYQFLHAAAAVRPQDATLFLNLALTCVHNTRYGEALRALEHAQTLPAPLELAAKVRKELAVVQTLVAKDLALRGPDFTLDQLITQQALYQQAMTLLETEQWAAAQALFEQVIALGDVLPQPHGNLGLCLLLQDRQAEAEVALRRALTMDPAYLPAQQNLFALEEWRRTGEKPQWTGVTLAHTGEPPGVDLVLKNR